MATTGKRNALGEMIGIMERFQWDMAHEATRDRALPEEWRKVWQERSSKKRKISLYVDEDVYRLFRSMGTGVGPRMNTVLSAFVRARVAGMLDGDDLLEEYREKWMGKPKPQIAEIIAKMEGK